MSTTHIKQIIIDSDNGVFMVRNEYEMSHLSVQKTEEEIKTEYNINYINGLFTEFDTIT